MNDLQRILLLFILILPACLCMSVSDLDALPAKQVETPQAYFGFLPGADRQLFDYQELMGYLQKVDRASPRLKLVEAGHSPMGNKIYIAFISSPENIDHLEQLGEINKRLALDPHIPEAERKAMVEKGKVFVLTTLSMHSTEIGPSQSAPRIAYDLATTDAPDVKKWLDDVVLMMVPCHNPDGMDMVVNHYKKYRGTPYEGSSMPGVYHKYVGHDNNRDFITLSQEDTRVIARIYNLEWFPQVMLEKHQMGQTGARYFVPPMHDPIAENVDEGIWNWIGVFGANLVKDMTGQGLTGISQHYLFDMYWPGSTETAIWKNMIGFLTEAASAKLASPVFVEPNELKVSGKGLAEYKKSINMAVPWPGGWWRLNDIIEYEIASTMSILKTASRHREEILRFRNDLCKKEVMKGRSSPPYYFILPSAQHNQGELVHLVNLMKEHGVDVYRLSEESVIEEKTFKKGDIVIPLAQPYRAFIKEVMEPQAFPVRHYMPGGEMIKPYEFTSWSLPLHMGLKAVQIDARSRELESQLHKIEGNYHLRKDIPPEFRSMIFPINCNESYKAAFRALALGLEVHRIEESLRVGETEIPAGSFILQGKGQKSSVMKNFLNELAVSPIFINESLKIKTQPLVLPRMALVETYFHDMDAGWTRFLFDTYHLPYQVIRPGEFEAIDFEKQFDVVIFPDMDESVLLQGKKKSRDPGEYIISRYPPEFTKGMGDAGRERLMAFVDQGGNVVAWGRSTQLFMETLKIKRSGDEVEEFQLPVKEISQELKKSGLYCPGSLMKVRLLADHPLTLGCEGEIGGFFKGEPVFSTSIPSFDMDRRVIARFPEKDILLSGYCKGEENLADKTVMVWLKKGKGQLVFFGFNPQFRASTQGTFKLVFNAILLPQIE